MANYYTQFSTTIDDLTDKEIEWWEKELQCPDELEDGEREKREKELDELGVTETDCWPDFAWEFHGNSLWIYAEEYGNTTNVSIAAQQFLHRFRPNGRFSMAWASWCSKLRVDEFHGGAMFVTHDNIEWMSSWDWLNKKEQERK